MNYRFLGSLAVLRVVVSATQAAYSPRLSSDRVGSVEYTWHDKQRDRDVPVKIYYPTNETKPCPLVIFSHGLGGSRESYDYFGEYLAGCGYVCMHLQHLGSDTSIWKRKPLTQLKEEMQASARDPQNALNRTKDVSFAIDQMQEMNARAVTAFSVDFNRIAVAGHSFGAWTALAVAGEDVAGKSLADQRVKAAVAMSAPVNIPQRQNGAAFSTISIPVLHLTGTNDRGAVFDTTPADRRIPFDNAKRAPAFLVTFNGADHMTFGKHLRPDAAASDEKFHTLIAQTSVAFLDAYLRGESEAKQWLSGQEVNAFLGDAAKIEKKP